MNQDTYDAGQAYSCRRSFVGFNQTYNLDEYKQNLWSKDGAPRHHAVRWSNILNVNKFRADKKSIQKIFTSLSYGNRTCTTAFCSSLTSN